MPVTITATRVYTPHGTSAGGWPSASNTGVPAGTTLAASGSRTVTAAGTVLDGLDITGDVVIRAANVTIRRCRITGGSSGNGIYVESGNVVIEDCEIIGFENAIGFSNWSAYRCNIHSQTGDGVKFGSDTTLSACYIHDPNPSAGSHADGGQVQFGVTDLVVTGNTIDMSSAGSDANAALFIAPDQGPSTDGPITIDHNYLDGGNYTIFCNDGDWGTYIVDNITISYNTFGPHHQYGTHTVNVPVTWVGNVTSTGSPVTL